MISITFIIGAINIPEDIKLQFTINSLLDIYVLGYVLLLFEITYNNTKACKFTDKITLVV